MAKQLAGSPAEANAEANAGAHGTYVDVVGVDIIRAGVGQQRVELDTMSVI